MIQCEKCSMFAKCIMPFDVCPFNRPNKQTNEEWFCSLDTEDKAREISDMTAQGYWSEELVYKWLKQPHTVKE